MGFRHAMVLGPVSFFLGILFICFTVDHKLLWGALTDDIIEDGFQFYGTFFNSPTAIKALLHGMCAVGLLGLVSKLHKWDESAMFFDGSSIGIYVFALAVYLSVTIPTLRTVVTPAAMDTRSDRIEALRVLSAGNVIIGLCLGGILLMQAGQEYARRSAVVEVDEEKKKN
ncbi:hypothetical protein BDZ89DRAFT_978486 [Hymenopellis radicata]|nr:hypothetical protein BDZ89DRAFT_978486 [Hymenopellis radicata]